MENAENWKYAAENLEICRISLLLARHPKDRKENAHAAEGWRTWISRSRKRRNGRSTTTGSTASHRKQRWRIKTRRIMPEKKVFSRSIRSDRKKGKAVSAGYALLRESVNSRNAAKGYLCERKAPPGCPGRKRKRSLRNRPKGIWLEERAGKIGIR